MKKTYTHIVKDNFLIILCNIVLAMLTQLEIKAQQANNWYFYNRAGITFNTNSPSTLIDGQSDNFGTACMSDENGKLIFYSDATQVWNRQQQIMPNGNNLWGACSVVGSNFSITIPFPNNPNLYYLFLGECSGNPPSGYSSYNYSVIDKTLNGGLGGISLKNQLVARPSGERMTTVMHSNGVESWFVTLERGNLIYNTYKVACNGLSLAPIKDTFELHDPLDSIYYCWGGGDMKTSFQNDRLAVSFRTPDNGWVDLYKFNNTTGHIFNNIRIPFSKNSLGSYDSPYDISFSKNGKYLYSTETIVGNGLVNTIVQLCRYNLNLWDSTTIKNSRQVLFSPSYLYLAGLQIGPDDNLYFVRGNYLGVLKNPDAINPIIIDSFINLSPGLNATFLPKFASNLISNQNVQTTYTVAPDCRTVTLKAKTYIKGKTLAFKWKFGDGDSSIQNIPSGGDTTYTTIVHTYPLVSGVDTFFASLTVTSDTVCGQGRAGAKVVVRPPPPIAKFGFAVGDCGSSTVQFTDGSLLNFNPSLTYQWAYKRAASSGAFTDFSIAPSPLFTFAAIDSFDVRLTVTSSLSCVNDNSITKRIYLTAAPVAAFTIADTCVGSTIRLQNISTGASISSYKWLFGNGDSSTAALPVYAYPAAGNYNIRLRIVTVHNCTASATQSININPIPLAAFSITESCLGKPIAIANNSNGSISSYNWRVSDGQNSATANPVILFNNEGSYTLSLKVQSAFGCSDSVSKPINIKAVNITAISDTSILTNQPLQLSANGAANYLWQPATLLNNATGSNPIFKATNSGLYPILVQGTTLQGCKGTAAINITVYNTKAGLLIPNTFSPNGDNLNDKLRFNCTGLQSLTYFRIFNRYGQSVYEQRTCGNAVGWDGKYKGVAQNPGAYIYLWQGVSFEGKLMNGKGTVMLVR